MTDTKSKSSNLLLLRASAFMLLTWRRLWPLLVPSFIVLCSFLTLSWIGIWRLEFFQTNGVLLGIFQGLLVAIVIASLLPLRRLVLPSKEEIERQIEFQSDLKDRPLTAQNDQLASDRPSDFADVLWREHQSRMRHRLENMTAGSPSADGGKSDPFLLRAILPICVFAAFCVSFSPLGGRIGDVLGYNGLQSQDAVRFDAWIAPPPYTRVSPIYLSNRTPDGDDPLNVVKVPEGSEFNLRFVGEGSIEVEHQEAAKQSTLEVAGNPENENRDIKASLSEDGTLTLFKDGRKLAEWSYVIIPDLPPTIGFFEHPSGALSGSLQLTYTVEDDYGAKQGRALIEPKRTPKPGARPLIDNPDVALSVPRSRGQKAVSKATKDLTEHPLSGSEVEITLEVSDAAKQTGRTETRTFTLPGRRFSDPLARALVEQRRILALDANEKTFVSDVLFSVADGANNFVESANVSISLAVLYRRLRNANTDDELRDVLDLYWNIALGIESGELSDLEQRLRDAQEKLAEALENNASDEEIARLMDELRQAMDEMLQALAQSQPDNMQAQNPFQQDSARQLTQRDLNNMLDRLENLARSGSKDAARELLSEMQRMMENLRAGQHQQQRQAEGDQVNKSLDQLSELMQRQQELMEETYRLGRQQREQQRRQQEGQNGQSQPNQQGQQGQQNQQGQQGQQQGSEGSMSEQELADALKQLQQQQSQLQQQLGQLQQDLEALGLGQSEEMQEAENQMGQAGKNLGKGETGPAAGNQGKALEALRKGAQSMMQQMAGDRDQGGQQAGERGEGGQQRTGRRNDPLGRNTGQNANSFSSDVEIPDEIDAARAREIIDAIRKRLSIPNNPILEKEYLERLLNTD